MALVKKRLMDVVSVDNATVNSSSVAMNLAGTSGVGALYFVSSAAGSLTVTQQCSMDDVNWYTPVDKNNVSVTPVVPAGTGADTGRIIVFDIAFAPYIRFSCVEAGTAATNVTLELAFLEKE